MKMLTFIPVQEIKEYEKLSGSDINKAKEKLAYEITKLVHGEEEAEKSMKTARSLFGNKNLNSEVPLFKFPKEKLSENSTELLLVLTESGLASSKSEARRLISQGGISIDGKKIDDTAYIVDNESIKKGIVIKKGKKVYKKISL